MKKPPPIQWLPVFEAAARLLNFKKAADELCVSPPAISQQIKVLEEYLGVCLFDRSNKQLRLTSTGIFYFEHVQDIINRHVESYRELERNHRHSVLQLTAPIFIAQELLIPNYYLFNQLSPKVELRLITGKEYFNFEHDPTEAELRFGSGDWPNLNCKKICDVSVNLVCNETYLNHHQALLSKNLNESNFEDLVLLTVSEDLQDWKTVIPNLRFAKKIVCDSYFSVIKSAEAGLGIALGAIPVINQIVRSNRLKLLLESNISTNHSYWLVTPKQYENSQNLDDVNQWLHKLFESIN